MNRKKNRENTRLRIPSAILSFCIVAILLFPGTVHVANTEGAVDTDYISGAEDTLQDVIDNASGNTITLTADKTYIGGIIVNKALTIEGDGTQTIEGAITYSAPLTIKNATLTQGISGTDSLTVEKCKVFGGIQITDSGSAHVKIWDSFLHFNNVTPAITVIGSPTAANYLIGDDPATGPHQAKHPNTFVNDSAEKASVISWPEGVQQLNAGKNYWKMGNNDALYHDILVSGDVRYYERIQIHSLGIPSWFKFIPPVGAVFEKGGYNSGSPNTAEGYIQTWDYMCFLYARSFRSAGLPILDVDTFMVDSLIVDPSNPTKLPKEYLAKCKSAIYKDSSLIVPYLPEELATKVWNEGQSLYFGMWDPMLPMEVTPKSMVSYAGTTGDLDDSFPKVHYNFVTPNTLWFPDQPNTGPKFYTYQQQAIEYQGSRVPLLGGYLTDKGQYYVPGQPDPDLDPDGDWLPFKEGFFIDNTPAAVSQGGEYSIAVTNRDNITQIGFYSLFAQMVGIEWEDPWRFLGYYSGKLPGPVPFYSKFQPGDLTVRPTSGDLTVAPVAATMPATPSKPTAVIDAGATYQDSTGQALVVATVSLLNDNKEPTNAIYDKMLAIAGSNAATMGKTYRHHYLSLLNVADGNNVVTTNAAKTVYIPYPSDYKKGSAITLLHFGNYHRMPNETVEEANVTVIADADITRQDKGFTFATTGNMGAYIIAYEKASAPITPPDPSNPPVTPPDPSNPPVTPPVTDKPSVTPPVTDKPSVTPPVTDKPPVTSPNSDKPSVTPPVTDKPSVTPPVTDKPPVTSPNSDKLPVTPPDTDKLPLPPQTGDAGALPWGVAAVCSGLALVLICNKKKKSDQE